MSKKTKDEFSDTFTYLFMKASHVVLIIIIMTIFNEETFSLTRLVPRCLVSRGTVDLISYKE